MPGNTYRFTSGSEFASKETLEKSIQAEIAKQALLREVATETPTLHRAPNLILLKSILEPFMDGIMLEEEATNLAKKARDAYMEHYLITNEVDLGNFALFGTDEEVLSSMYYRTSSQLYE